jgi:hypothetical protein
MSAQEIMMMMQQQLKVSSGIDILDVDLRAEACKVAGGYTHYPL